MKLSNRILLMVLTVSCLYGQQVPQQSPLSIQAFQEYATGRYSEAERDFREVVRLDPSNVQGQMFLGHTLYRQQRFVDATGPYELARALEKAGEEISLVERRVLIDQLVMAYGISGQFEEAHGVLEEAIAQDPEYPLNYYNAACTFAEEGNKAEMLASLALAFQYKDGMIGGRPLPNPRTDSSFNAFVGDKDFKKLAKKNGYK